MSYSEHFRRKILAKLEEGYSIRAVAAQFEINKNTIVEWKKRIEIKKLVYVNLLKLTMMLYVKMLKSILMLINMNVLHVLIVVFHLLVLH
jgi:hypothetical protein